MDIGKPQNQLFFQDSSCICSLKFDYRNYLGNYTIPSGAFHVTQTEYIPEFRRSKSLSAIYTASLEARTVFMMESERLIKA